jgi:hypothetical protein
MAIFELSAARELSTEIPIERRIAAPKNNSATYKILFITYLPKSTYANDLFSILIILQKALRRNHDSISLGSLTSNSWELSVSANPLYIRRNQRLVLEGIHLCGILLES